MRMTFHRLGLLGAVLACLVALACSPLKDSAEAAIADATAALQKIGPEAEKFAPTEYAAANAELAAMKAAFEKKDYESVLNTVHKLGPDLRVLAETVQDKKRQVRLALNDQWAGMSKEVPKSISSVEAKVAELNKAHRLPNGVTKDAVASAGPGVDAAKQSWSDAQSAKSAGNVEDAVAKGKATQDKLSELMTSLGMSGGATAAK